MTTEHQGTIERTVGGDLLSTIIDLASRDPIHSVIELLANSYDADATEVNVQYDPEVGQLVVRDNGLGMSSEELIAFYRSGDSLKKDDSITERGRTKLGSYGVATILLSHLAASYELVTTKDGVTTVIEEMFSKELKIGDSLDYRSFSTPDSVPGTEIRMRDLRFSDSDFNLKELKRRIQWELPIHLPDFTVFVNEEEVTPRKLETAVQFEIDEEGEQMGRVEGIFYFCTRSQKDSGIHIYVNGRRIGDARAILDSVSQKRGLSGRIIGIINANGLERIISFDRSRFKEHTPEYRELEAGLAAVVRSIRTYNEQQVKVSHKKGVEDRVNASLDAVRIKFSDSGIGEINSYTMVALTDGMQPWEIGRYNQDNNTVDLNFEHPMFAFPLGTKPNAYQAAVECALVDVIALHRVKASADSFREYQTQRRQIWDQLHPEGLVEVKRFADIQPRILYPKREIRDRLDMSTSELEYVRASGLLGSPEAGRISGRNLLIYLDKTHGLIPLYTFLMENFDDPQQRLATLHDILEKIWQNVDPVIRNLGKETPCYFLDDSCVHLIKTTIEGFAADSRRVTSNFQTRLTQSYGLERLSEIFPNLGEQRVKDVLRYAKASDLPMNRSPVEGEVHTLDFVGALQHNRSTEYRRAN